MSTLRNLLTLVSIVFALPLFAQTGGGRIEILIDPVAHRAYVPVGTILPHGLEVRGIVRSANSPNDHSSNHPALGAPPAASPAEGESLLRAQPPLVFEYAPESRFEAARKHYRDGVAARRRGRKIVALSQYCNTLTIMEETQGQYGPYDSFFDSTFCYDSSTSPNQMGSWSFTAYTYAQDETWAHITDDLSNYWCYNSPYGYSSATCTASHNSVLQYNPANNVYTEGFARHYEWLDNYVLNPVDFFFSVQWVAYFE